MSATGGVWLAEIPLLEFDEDRQAVIEPSRAVKPVEGLPEGCVLCFFQDVFEKLTAELGEPIASLRTEFARHPVYLLEHRGQKLGLLHPGVGAPLAACMLEEAIALGFRKFVACGSAGVLDKEITPGHFMLPFAAVRDEGTSFHYLPPAREVRADPLVVRVLEETLRQSQRPYLLCRTWTTDAVYRETRARVDRRRAEGCLTVEMETAALLAVAQFRGVKLGQYLYGGDDVSGADWDPRDWHRLAVRETLFWLAADALLNL